MKELNQKDQQEQLLPSEQPLHSFFDEDNIPTHQVQCIFNEAWMCFMAQKMSDGSPSRSQLNDFLSTHTIINRLLGDAQIKEVW